MIVEIREKFRQQLGKSGHNKMMNWRAYFEDENGLVLRSTHSFASAHEASMWGSACLERTDLFEVEDPFGQVVSADKIDPDRGITIESEET